MAFDNFVFDLRLAELLKLCQWKQVLPVMLQEVLTNSILITYYLRPNLVDISLVQGRLQVDVVAFSHNQYRENWNTFGLVKIIESNNNLCWNVDNNKIEQRDGPM